MWRLFETRKPETGKGALAGMIAGLAASWAMNRFQALLAGQGSGGGGSQGEQRDARIEESREQQRQSSAGGGSEPATLKAAVAVSEGVFGHELKPREKRVAEPLVHYGYGALVGAAFGAVAEHWEPVTAGLGLPFGSGLWLVSDEMAVPLAGLSGPPQDYPIRSHLAALAAHLVYGTTTELLRRALRRVI